MKPWQFSKPQGPGFGISSRFYLTVLGSNWALPTVSEWISPKGTDGAVQGFGAPMMSAEKSELNQPIRRGMYALASPDKKTVIKALVMDPGEVGFSPEIVAQSPLVVDWSAEAKTRLASTKALIQFNFETHDPEVYPACAFLLSVASRLGILTEGLVGDPICQRYEMPEAFLPLSSQRLDVSQYVTTNMRARAGGLTVYTLGLQKFGLEELEIEGIRPGNESGAQHFLLSAAQEILRGAKLVEGAHVGSSRVPFTARIGGLDRSFWAGLPVFELVPPLDAVPEQAIEAWYSEVQS